MKQNKKHQRKRQTKAVNRLWGRTIGGYFGLKHIGLLLAIVVLSGSVVGVSTLLRPNRTSHDPLPSLSFAPDAPNTAEIMKLINNTRTSNGLDAVMTDIGLDAVAEERLEDMVRHQYYSHQNLKGKYYYELFAIHDFSAAYSCENLGLEPSRDAARFVDSWLESKEGHKDCLLNEKVDRIGIAASKFSDGSEGSTDPTYLVVTIYGADLMPR